MPVRRFDGSDDLLRCATGGAEQFGAWTMAILMRPTVLGYRVVYQGHDAGGTARGYGFETSYDGRLALYASGGGEVRSTGIFLALDEWRLAAISKAEGLVAPRFHSYNFTTRAWTRETSGSMSNPSVVASAEVRFGQWGANYFYGGDIAAAAIWPAALADVAIDQLATVGSLAGWASVGSPVALWLFDQASSSTPVQDLIGTADQVGAPVGTTVLAEEPPIPYASRGAIASWNGTSWATCPVHVYNGTGWVQAAGVARV